MLDLAVATTAPAEIHSDFYLAVDTVTPVVLLSFGLLSVVSGVMMQNIKKWALNETYVNFMHEIRLRIRAGGKIRASDYFKSFPIMFKAGAYKGLLLALLLFYTPIVGAVAIILASVALAFETPNQGLLLFAGLSFFLFLGMTLLNGVLALMTSYRSLMRGTSGELAKEFADLYPHLVYGDRRTRDPGFL